MTSLREYLSRVKAYQMKQQREWELARWTAFSIFSPFVKNGPRTASQWVRFPWETIEKARIVHIDSETETRLNEIYLDFMSRKKNMTS